MYLHSHAWPAAPRDPSGARISRRDPLTGQSSLSRPTHTAVMTLLPSTCIPLRARGPLFRVILEEREYLVQPLLLAGVEVHGSGFRVQGSGFRVQGSGFRIHGSGSRVQGSGFRVQSSGFRVQRLGFRVQGSSRVSGFGFEVSGLMLT